MHLKALVRSTASIATIVSSLVVGALTALMAVVLPASSASAASTNPAYWLVGADGGVFAFGGAPYEGTTSGQALTAPIVGMAGTADGKGYWLAGAAGAVYNFGDAPSLGTLSGVSLGAPIRAIAATPDGGGFWLVGGDGGIFSFGDANYYGSLPADHIKVSNIVAIVPTATGKGYWVFGNDGGAFAFGDAAYYGSLPGDHVSVSNVVGAVSTSDGKGYLLAGSDGGVFAFGDASFAGSMGGKALAKPVVGIAVNPAGSGYWLDASDGGIFAFGGAPFLGSMGGQTLAKPVVGMAATTVPAPPPTAAAGGSQPPTTPTGTGTTGTGGSGGSGGSGGGGGGGGGGIPTGASAPISMSTTESPSTGTLGKGAVLGVTFDQPVGLQSGWTVLLTDGTNNGTLSASNATTSITNSNKTLTLTLTGAPSGPTGGKLDLTKPLEVLSATGVQNSAGNWNLPMSGAVPASGTTSSMTYSRVFGGTNSAITTPAAPSIYDVIPVTTQDLTGPEVITACTPGMNDVVYDATSGTSLASASCGTGGTAGLDYIPVSGLKSLEDVVVTQVDPTATTQYESATGVAPQITGIVMKTSGANETATLTYDQPVTCPSSSPTVSAENASQFFYGPKGDTKVADLVYASSVTCPSSAGSNTLVVQFANAIPTGTQLWFKYQGYGTDAGGNQVFVTAGTSSPFNGQRAASQSTAVTTS